MKEKNIERKIFKEKQKINKKQLSQKGKQRKKTKKKKKKQKTKTIIKTIRKQLPRKGETVRLIMINRLSNVGQSRENN